MRQAVLGRRELSKGIKLKVVKATMMPFCCNVVKCSKVLASPMTVLRRIQGVLLVEWRE